MFALLPALPHAPRIHVADKSMHVWRRRAKVVVPKLCTRSRQRHVNIGGGKDDKSTGGMVMGRGHCNAMTDID